MLRRKIALPGGSFPSCSFRARRWSAGVAADLRATEFGLLHAELARAGAIGSSTLRGCTTAGSRLRPVTAPSRRDGLFEPAAAPSCNHEVSSSTSPARSPRRYNCRSVGRGRVVASSFRFS